MVKLASSEPTELFAQVVNGGLNAFLTGMAGTGKSTILRDMIAHFGDAVTVTASTGIAALNIGGFTLHRWSGMMLGPQDGQSNEDCLKHLMADKRFSVRAGFDRVRECKLLIIDEISMLSGRTLDFLDFLCRRLRECDFPFGGIQVVATGDFLQLPPVRKNPAMPYDWVFLSRAWREAAFEVVNLTKVHRQDNADFVRALSEFRVGRVTGHNARLLRARVAKFPEANLTRLFTHNAQVDKWNAYRLGELESESRTFDAELQGPEHQQQFLINNLLTPQRLELKRGARVMFTVNNSEGGFVNGQTGIVTDFSHGRITVETDDRQYSVEPFTWAYDSRDKRSAIFRQFPLRLSYALTIHKSQGLTLDSAYIDVRAAREPGQAYVALSRLRTLDGLNLKDWFSGVFVSKAATEFYRNAA